MSKDFILQRDGTTAYSEAWHKHREKQAQATEAQNTVSSVDRSIFIPLTWPRVGDFPYYEETDKEWKEFQKLHHDPTLAKTTKQKIAMKICVVAIQSPGVYAQLGKPSGSSASIDFFYPNTRNPHYEWSGLRFLDGKLSWDTKRIPPERMQKFNKVFVALPFFWGGVEGMKAFGQYHYDSVRTYLGYEVARRSHVHPVAKAEPVVEATEKSSAPARPPTESTLLAITTRQTDFLKEIVKSPAPDSAIKAASQAFKVTFALKWMEATRVVPDGYCSVQGCIDLYGEKGQVKIWMSCIFFPADGIITNLLLKEMRFYPNKLTTGAQMEDEVKQRADQTKLVASVSETTETTSTILKQGEIASQPSAGTCSCGKSRAESCTER